MPLAALGICALCAALLFVLLCRRYADRCWLRPCISLALAVWFLIVLWMTVLKRSPGFYDANWIPLYSYRDALSGDQPEALRSAFMNVMLFFPAGLLCSGLAETRIGSRKWICWLLAVFALFSLGIELSQYWFQLGVGETDDILHNTLGAQLGYASCQRMFALGRRSRDTNRESP